MHAPLVDADGRGHVVTLVGRLERVVIFAGKAR